MSWTNGSRGSYSKKRNRIARQHTNRKPKENTMQCDAKTNKNTQCTKNGQWYQWSPENMIIPKSLAGFYSSLCTIHTEKANAVISNVTPENEGHKAIQLEVFLYNPPRTNRDDEVNLADYKDKVITDLKDQTQAITEAAANSPLAQAYINKEPIMDPNDHNLPTIMKKEADMCDDTDKTQLILMGTGSRSLKTAPAERKAEVRALLRLELERVIAKYDEVTIVSGMAEGWDELLAITAFEYSLPVIAHLPNTSYGRYYWGDHSLTGNDRMAEFLSIRNRCEQVVYTTQLIAAMLPKADIKPNAIKVPFYDIVKREFHPTYMEYTNMARNTQMILSSTACVVYDPSSSGTANCVKTMRRINFPFKVIG